MKFCRHHCSRFTCLIGLWLFCLTLCALSCASVACMAEMIASVYPANILEGAAASHDTNTTYIRDPILLRNWAMTTDRVHPDWPAHLLAVDPDVYYRDASTQSRNREITEDRASLPVVGIGNVVTVWKQDACSRIQLKGVVEERGRLGARIRIRFIEPQFNDWWR
jgi:hypothetical protein